MRPVLLLFLSMFLWLNACSYKKKSEPIALVGDHEIYLSEVDSMISQQLYERLYDIYYNRKIALDAVIEDKLLIQEAVRRGITIDSLLYYEIESKLSDSLVRRIIEENGLQNRFPDGSGGWIESSSDEGLYRINQLAHSKLKFDFVNKLKEEYKVKILLKAPITPKINFTNLARHNINDSDSDVRVTFVINFDCSACNSTLHLIDKLINHYKSNVIFDFAILADTLSYSTIFCECAVKEGNNYFLFTTLLKEVGDDKYNKLIKGLNLNSSYLDTCIKNNKVVRNKIDKSINELKLKGINQTPFVIIDNRKYLGSLDFENITKSIDAALELY